MKQNMFDMTGATFNESVTDSIDSLLKKLALRHEEWLNLCQKFDGKQLLRSEIQLSEKVFSLLVHLGVFTKVGSLHKSIWGIRCIRCNNYDRKRIGIIPCATCKRKHYYCRNCIQMGRVSECEYLYRWRGNPYTWPKHEQPCTWTGKLTSVQQRAADQIVTTIHNNEEILIWAVTGSGKTEMLFPGLTNALQAGKRICIATPRADVVRELLPRIKEAFTNISIEGLYAGSADRNGTAQLIIATTHQLLRFVDAFDVLIIDEIDAFPFHQDQTLQFAANRAMKTRGAKIYLTATPRKKERIKMHTGHLPYCFVPLRYHGHLLPIPKLMYARNLTKELQNNELPSAFLHWLLHRNKPSRQILLFVPTIALAEQLKFPIQQWMNQTYKQPFYRVESVHAEDKHRKEKVTQFRQNEIDLFITTTILERGVTFPSIDVVVLDAGHVVFDEAALIQIAGRAGRNAADPTGEVIFIHHGKTNAMEKAVYEIKAMNRRGKQLLT